MDDIKEAFGRVKKDIFSLNEDLYEIKKDINMIISEISDIKNTIFGPKNSFKNQAEEPFFQTYIGDNPAHNGVFKPLNNQNQGISTGNGGVPADRQTDRQTDTYEKSGENSKKNSFDDAIKTLETLDNVKKEIRLKFKKLTEKEFLVFTTIYQLEEEGEKQITYPKISERLNLTESSVRDYVGKIYKKGAPVEKIKLNNKIILLSLAENFRKIVSLPTLFQLRDL